MLLFCVLLNFYFVATNVATNFYKPAKFNSWEEGPIGGEPKSTLFNTF